MSKLLKNSGIFGLSGRHKYQFSIEESSSSTELLREPVMEEFKLAVAEKSELQNPDVINNKFFGIFGLSGVGSKEKA